MTFDELMQMFQQTQMTGGGGGTGMNSGYEGNQTVYENPAFGVTPDGRRIQQNGDGFDLFRPDSNAAPGQMQLWDTYNPDGSVTAGSYQNPEEGFASKYGLPLVGGLALGGLGLAAAGALPGVAGIGGTGAAGAGAAEAAALAAAENGIIGSTVGMAPGTAAAYGTGAAGAAGAAGSGAMGVSGAGDFGILGGGEGFWNPDGTWLGPGGAGSAAGFPGEGAVSGVPGWDSAAGSGAQGSMSGIQGAIQRLIGGGADAAGGFDWSRLLGPAIGAVAGALGSGDSTATRTESMDPASQANLDAFRSRAQGIADQPYQAPGFSLTQGPDANQTDGSAAMRAAMGSPMVGAANDTLTGFMDGSRDGTAAVNSMFGMDNPELTRQIDFATGDLSRAYENTQMPKFSMGSSFGNTGIGTAEVDSRNDLMRNLGRVGSDMRFANYGLQAQLGESAAGRQDAMTNSNLNRSLSAVPFAQQGVRDQASMAQNLFGQGSTLWNQGQQNIGNQYAEFNRQQDWGRNQLSAMNAGLQAGGRTTTATTQGNPWAGAFGGAALGYRATQPGSLFG